MHAHSAGSPIESNGPIRLVCAALLFYTSENPGTEILSSTQILLCVLPEVNSVWFTPKRMWIVLEPVSSVYTKP